jgi:hypothetical protein
VTPVLPILALLSSSWLGITLGEPYSAVFARMGDPVVATHDNRSAKFVYLTDRENAFLTVITEHGRVSGLRLWSLPTATPSTTDPFGIRLNEDAQKLLDARGKPSRSAADADGPFDAYQSGDVLWLYYLNGNGTVRAITLAATEDSVAAMPEQPLPALHAGASPADAIVVDAPSRGDSQRWEGMFFAVHPCANDGTWRVGKRTTQMQEGSAYDAVTATCSTGGAAQTLFFRRVPAGPP